MAGRLEVILDPTEPRPYKGRLAVGGDGSTWDYSKSENVWIDPCTSTVMLKPLPLTTEWRTTFSGNYSRTPKSSFSGTDISKWRQFSKGTNASDYAIELVQTSTNRLNLTTSLSRNQPMFVSFHRNEVQEPDDTVFLVINYNYGAGGSSPDNFSISLKFRSNGSVGVFRNGILDGEYDRSSSNFSEARTYVSTFNPTQKWVNMLIIPFRGRELLVWTDNGLAFSHTFSHLDYPNDPDVNPILPAGQMSFEVPTGKIRLQVAKCYFKQSGYIMTPPKTLRYAPELSDYVNQFEKIYHEYFGLGATFPTMSTTVVEDVASYPTFVANGTKKNVRLKVSFSGASGGTNSGLYAADNYWTPDNNTSAGSYSVNITSAIERLSMNVAEDGRTTIQMDCRARKLVSLGVSQPTITSDRPIQIRLRSDNATQQYIDIFRGTLSPPKIQYEPGLDELDLALLTFSGSDRYYDFELATLQEASPLDGDTLQDLCDNLLPIAGYDTADYLYLSTNSFETPYSSDISKGNYSFMPERGDTVGGLLQKVKDDYFATWFIGWYPSPTSATGPTPGGYKFQFRDPDDVSASVLTLWMSSYDAIAYGGLSNANGGTLRRTIRNLNKYFEPAEANQIAVVGVDPRNKRLIYSYLIDTDSQDPTYIPSARPQNWRGRPVPYIYTDPSITTQAGANQAAQLLYNRISTGRQIVEWESDFLYYNYTDGTLGANTLNVPWLGDVITIMNPSDPDCVWDPETEEVNPCIPEAMGDYQIISIDVDFIKDSTTDSGLHFRSARYKGVYYVAPEEEE